MCRIHRKKYLVAVNLDTENRWHDLESKNHPNTQRNWDQQKHYFLKKRLIKVKFQSSYTPRTATDDGLPQDSILQSTALFLKGINKIRIIIHGPLYIYLYAEHINILCIGKILSSTQDLLQQTIYDIVDWTHTTRFIKQQVWVYGLLPQYKTNRQHQNKPLKRSTKILILGLTDQRRTWKPHIIQKIKCQKRPNIIKTFSSNQCSVSKEIIISSYKALYYIAK